MAAPQDVLPGGDDAYDDTMASLGESDDIDDLVDMDLEALLDIECTVVSRRPERVASAPAAVYVLTGEEIRRAGHTSVQEALRMVPGMFVSHWDDSEWDATIRGFGPGLADANLAYLNQVLVMIDGVVVYTPVFAGMWWGLQDMDLEHVDRIEVIRGPSGILWGANAFHGLINIVTKDSADTQGMRTSVRVSNQDHFVTMRGSGRINDEMTFSTFVRRSRYDGLEYRAGAQNNDESDLSDWDINSAGLQLDGKLERGTTWRLWGRGYRSQVEKSFLVGPGLFDRDIDSKHGGQIALQANDEETGLAFSAAYVKDFQHLPFSAHQLDTDHMQLELKHEFDLTDRQRVSWGLGYDFVHSNVNYYGDFAAGSFRQKNTRAFLSDTWSDPELGLTISAGIQAIDHEYSGFDVQPSVRAAWDTKTCGTYWASVSRAIRTPTVEEELFGDGSLDNEVVVAIEAGWRKRLWDTVAIDIATYVNDYDKVRTRFFDDGSDGNPMPTFLDTYSNESSGNARGVEIGLDIDASEAWTLRTTYAYHDSTHIQRGGNLPEVSEVDEQYPRHIASIRSYFDLAENWELDMAGYVVEGFKGDFDPEYTRGDMRLGYRPNDHVRISAGVQGYNSRFRREFSPANEIGRLYYVSLDLTR